jgi:hypothetical protein
MTPVKREVAIESFLAVGNEGTVGGRCVDYFSCVDKREVLAVLYCSRLVTRDRTANVLSFWLVLGFTERPFQRF